MIAFAQSSFPFLSCLSFIDFKDIWKTAGLTKNKHAEVFNGISISEHPDILYVTGKLSSNMFKIKLLPALDGDSS